MMSLPRRQFNLIGITDPVYRFGQSGGRNPRGNAQLSPSRFPRILFSVEVRLRRISAALKNFAGDKPASTDSLSASSLAAFFVAGRANKTL
jgi:hypothetical protein